MIGDSMKIPRGAWAVVAATLLVASISGAVAATASPSGTAPKPLTVDGPDNPLPVAPASRPTLPATSTVTLVTGDRVQLDVNRDGTQSASVVSPTGGGKPTGTTYTGFTWRGDEYVIPNVAVPYLSTLDPRLFDVSYLVKAHLDDAHSSSLPVKVTYASASTTALPGVGVAHRSGASATAAVTKAQSRQFGQRLAEQWRASRSGASSQPVGHLAGVKRMELAPASDAPALPPSPSGPSVQPQVSRSGLPYHTLTINPIDQDGNPGIAIGFVQDLDDPQALPIWTSWDVNNPGPVSLSVPQGTYSVSFSVMNGPADDFTVKTALVIKPQITVDSDQTVTLDARTAVPYEVNLNPSVTAGYRQDLLTFTRAGAGVCCRVQGAGLEGLVNILTMHLFSIPYNNSITLYATPTPAVTKGVFGFDAYTQLTGDENGPSAQPRYELTFPEAGRIPSSLSYTVRQDDLTVMHQKVNAACVACASMQQQQAVSYMTYLPWAMNELGVGSLVPGEHTDYLYSSAPNLTYWETSVTAFVSAPDSGRAYVRRFISGRRTIIPGQQIQEEWFKGPFVPTGVAQPAETQVTGFVDPKNLSAICEACRQDENFELYLSNGNDSDPTHYAERASWTALDVLSTVDTGSLNFYRNGALAFTSDKAFSLLTFNPFSLDLPMLPEAATYRLDWTTSGELPVSSSNSSTQTEWTFHSGPDDAAAPISSSSLCEPDESRACSFLPLLFVRYDLALNEKQQARAGGPFDIKFTVAHQQNQAAPAGVGATVSVSYDDGKTWTEAQTPKGLGGNQFSTTIDHPELASTTGFVSLRVKAHDGSGNSVEQTIIRAYALTN
jgi:hypothetical protein